MKKNIILIGVMGFFISIISFNSWAQDAKVTTKKITVKAKKQNFKNALVAPTRKVFLRLQKQYEQARKEIKKDPNSKHIQSLRGKYKAANNTDLLSALKPHPISLTLAQGAMESAWGTSRFFKKANNVFGVWSFNKNEKRIAAKKKRKNKTIWIKKYDSIEDSVENYYHILATGPAYREFRKEKMRSNDPLILATKLDKYSEKGSQYGKELISMIKYNKFRKFDKI